VLCTVALEVALAAAEFELKLALELALALLSLAALPPLETTSTLVSARELAALNSLGIVVLNSPVTVATGANAVVDGVLDATTLVSGCWTLESRLSVETSTSKGWVCAHVEDCALLRPRREQSAEVRRRGRRILGKRDGEEEEWPRGYGFLRRFCC